MYQRIGSSSSSFLKPPMMRVHHGSKIIPNICGINTSSFLFPSYTTRQQHVRNYSSTTTTINHDHSPSSSSSSSSTTQGSMNWQNLYHLLLNNDNNSQPHISEDGTTHKSPSTSSMTVPTFNHVSSLKFDSVMKVMQKLSQQYVHKIFMEFKQLVVVVDQYPQVDSSLTQHIVDQLKEIIQKESLQNALLYFHNLPQKNHPSYILYLFQTILNNRLTLKILNEHAAVDYKKSIENSVMRILEEFEKATGPSCSPLTFAIYKSAIELLLFFEGHENAMKLFHIQFIKTIFKKKKKKIENDKTLATSGGIDSKTEIIFDEKYFTVHDLRDLFHLMIESRMNDKQRDTLNTDTYNDSSLHSMNTHSIDIDELFKYLNTTSKNILNEKNMIGFDSKTFELMILNAKSFKEAIQAFESIPSLLDGPYTTHHYSALLQQALKFNAPVESIQHYILPNIESKLDDYGYSLLLEYYASMSDFTQVKYIFNQINNQTLNNNNIKNITSNSNNNNNWMLTYRSAMKYLGHEMDLLSLMKACVKLDIPISQFTHLPKFTGKPIDVIPYFEEFMKMYEDSLRNEQVMILKRMITLIGQYFGLNSISCIYRYLLQSSLNVTQTMHSTSTTSSTTTTTSSTTTTSTTTPPIAVWSVTQKSILINQLIQYMTTQNMDVALQWFSNSCKNNNSITLENETFQLLCHQLNESAITEDEKKFALEFFKTHFKKFTNDQVIQENGLPCTLQELAFNIWRLKIEEPIAKASFEHLKKNIKRYLKEHGSVNDDDQIDSNDQSHVNNRIDTNNHDRIEITNHHTLSRMDQEDNNSMDQHDRHYDDHQKDHTSMATAKLVSEEFIIERVIESLCKTNRTLHAANIFSQLLSELEKMMNDTTITSNSTTTTTSITTGTSTTTTTTIEQVLHLIPSCYEFLSKLFHIIFEHMAESFVNTMESHAFLPQASSQSSSQSLLLLHDHTILSTSPSEQQQQVKRYSRMMTFYEQVIHKIPSLQHNTHTLRIYLKAHLHTEHFQSILLKRYPMMMDHNDDTMSNHTSVLTSESRVCANSYLMDTPTCNLILLYLLKHDHIVTSQKVRLTFEKKIEDMTWYLESFPNHETYVLMSQYYFEIVGNDEKAIQVCHTLIRLYPQMITSYHVLLDIYSKQNDLNDIDHVYLLIRQNKAIPNLETFRKLILSYLKHKNYITTAISLFKEMYQVYQIIPTDDITLNIFDTLQDSNLRKGFEFQKSIFESVLSLRNNFDGDSRTLKAIEKFLTLTTSCFLRGMDRIALEDSSLIYSVLNRIVNGNTCTVDHKSSSNNKLNSTPCPTNSTMAMNISKPWNTSTTSTTTTIINNNNKTSPSHSSSTFHSTPNIPCNNEIYYYSTLLFMKLVMKHKNQNRNNGKEPPLRKYLPYMNIGTLNGILTSLFRQHYFSAVWILYNMRPRELKGDLLTFYILTQCCRDDSDYFELKLLFQEIYDKNENYFSMMIHLEDEFSMSTLLNRYIGLTLIYEPDRVFQVIENLILHDQLFEISPLMRMRVMHEARKLNRTDIERKLALLGNDSSGSTSMREQQQQTVTKEKL
ncbi:hypothetical protein C9374_005745 [Naegleria lovaniensis]|uniref:Uncharacterized protein n=1 Tax=Naegleria lovaniensis TaxID=51637 RepID=A0AA88GP15_NAELO|nr:uncharacterized protein C9374_005745 [Naegleria lovaniensis]KAG2381953.1 hypothetical protein C9374_005745 [Naegleria lovaniensis]